MSFHPCADGTQDARSLVSYDNVTDESWTNFRKLVSAFCVSGQDFGLTPGLYVKGEFDNFGHEALLSR